MILIALLSIVTGIVDAVFGFIAQFFLPWGVDLQLILSNFLPVVYKGANMFYFFFGPVAVILVSYILTFQILKHTWDIVWFVIRKIPMLNIRE